MIKSMTFFSLFLLPFSFLFAQQEGDLFFAEGAVHEIRFHFTQPGYWDSLIANKPAEMYMKCTVSIDGIDYPQYGRSFQRKLLLQQPLHQKTIQNRL